MKNKIIGILVSKELSQEQKYNELSAIIATKINLMQARNFQLGYSDAKMEKLEYEIKKYFEISDTEIYEYKPEEIISESLGDNILKIPGNEGTTQNPATDPQNETQIYEQQKAVFAELEANEAAKQGLKIRDQYPFLNDPNCPEEFHILVGQKITAWKEFAKNHAALIEGIDEDDSEGKMYELAKSVVSEFQLNDDIRKELDFYKEQGKVLGDHPKLENLKIKQEIYELSEAGLVEMKNKANKNASKAKMEIQNKGTNEAREKRFADWTLREKLSIERLENEFKK